MPTCIARAALLLLLLLLLLMVHCTCPVTTRPAAAWLHALRLPCLPVGTAPRDSCIAWSAGEVVSTCKSRPTSQSRAVNFRLKCAAERMLLAAPEQARLHKLC